MTEREAALTARVAELEAVAAKRTTAGGNIVEQVWRYFGYFVPPSIILIALVVFIGL
jgi:hypothetical protein